MRIDWKSFLELALQNAGYAKQLLAYFPVLSPRLRKAVEVIIDHVAEHAECLVELAEKLSEVVAFGSTSPGEYPESLAAIAEEVTLLRMASTAANDPPRMASGTGGEPAQMSVEGILNILLTVATQELYDLWLSVEDMTLGQAAAKLMEALGID